MSLSALNSSPPSPGQTRRSPQFEADLSRLGDAMVTWPQTYLVGLLSRFVLRMRLGQPVTKAQRLFGAGVALGLRFLVPAAVTTATGSWADAPVWTWLGILAARAVLEASWVIGVIDPFLERAALPLAADIEQDADLHELVDFTRRRWRARFYVPAGVFIALVILATGAIVAPGDLRAPHPGSLALIVLILYEFGEERAMRLLYFGLYTQESRYPHRLSWFSPADSPAIQDLLGLWPKMAVANGFDLTVDFVFVIVLLTPDSLPALLGAISAFALAAVILDTTLLMRLRLSVQRVVRHTRTATLERVRRRIDDYEPHLEQLTKAEAEDLQRLISTYAAVREAPTGLSGTQTIGHALSAIAVPAVAFFLAVMSEVYAERVLNQFLP